jgi:hypothetical protein
MALLGGLRQRQLRAVEIAADELHDLRGRVAKERATWCWPSGLEALDSLIAIAAPHIAKPAPPMLDQTRSALPGRSDASPATFVVLPPPDPPVLPPLLIGTGPGAADVILQWTCTSPVARTPLGPHQIAVRVRAEGLVACRGHDPAAGARGEADDGRTHGVELARGVVHADAMNVDLHRPRAGTRGDHIASVTGTDPPAGSWKRAWYSATAWTVRRC